ncbi:NAD dependent epimerase/dehydratase [Mycolicibacterium conceptionense]|nr:NAD dependent epimerase/dehydratase [Mycolicibacterium conceptionense]
MVSAMAADDRSLDAGYDEVFLAYMHAKSEADADVRARTGLRTTIVRPGGLTDEPGTGKVTIAESTGRGTIPRADVAQVLLAVLHEPETAGRTFEVISGQTPIDAALHPTR